MGATSAQLDHFNLDMSDHPYWSESSWFSWAIPERSINGFFYNHFRHNMNCMLAGPAMWDLSGQHVWEFLYFDWQQIRLLPEGRYGVDYDKYDFQAPWGMSIQLLEPLSRYHLQYKRHRFKLDLVFEATAEPFVQASEPGEPAHMHFEQPGRIQGTVEVDGEHLAVDCFSIRDGGHGGRFLEDEFPPGAYTWSTADEGTAWQLIAMDKDGTRDTVVRSGYLMRDGKLAPLVKGVRRVLQRKGPRPVALEVTAEDSLGRELHAVGREKVPAEFMLFADHGQWWILYEWDYDGFTSAIGEDQEYYGIDQFRRWHRVGPQEWARR